MTGIQRAAETSDVVERLPVTLGLIVGEHRFATLGEDERRLLEHIETDQRISFDDEEIRAVTGNQLPGVFTAAESVGAGGGGHLDDAVR